jgi:hypothetical protein
MDMKSAEAGAFSGGEKTISNPKLPDLGVSLSLTMGMKQAGMTILSFQLTTDKASFLDIQVFDADGRPWPTLIQQMGGAAQNGMCQVMVMGAPKAPLSLAMLFSGSGGANIQAPILLEHVPVRGEAK